MDTEQQMSIRCTVNQAAAMANKEFDRLYSEVREKDEQILKIKTNNERLLLENDELKSDADIYEFRQAQLLDGMASTMILMIIGWIVAFIAIGYGVWVG